MVFHLEEECANQNITKVEHCGIVPANGSSPVVSYGSVTKGSFEGDPDIAGKGVLIALLFATVLIGALGVLLLLLRWYSIVVAWKDSKQTSYQHPEMYNSHPLCDRAHKLLDPIILSGSDAQVLLILAYGISFHLSFKCSISAYHYNVVLHVIFAGCATFTLSILFVHKYFENLITAGLRLITMIIILSVYGTFLRIQSASFDMYRIIPDKGTSDSILFLPAICLLDAGPSTPGDDSQQANPNDIMRNLTYLLNTFFATAVMIHAIPPISYKLKLRVKKGLTIKATCGVVAVKTMLCIVLLVLIGLEWSTIMQLRNWVDASGWMNKDDGNPEMDTMGIGQLVPLMALAAIAIPISDKVSEWLAKRCCWGEFATEREDRNYIELERRNQALSWVPPRD